MSIFLKIISYWNYFLPKIEFFYYSDFTKDEELIINPQIMVELDLGLSDIDSNLSTRINSNTKTGPPQC